MEDKYLCGFKINGKILKKQNETNYVSTMLKKQHHFSQVTYEAAHLQALANPITIPWRPQPSQRGAAKPEMSTPALISIRR